MKTLFTAALLGAVALAAPVVAQKAKRTTDPGMLTLYEMPNYNGERVTVAKGRPNLTLEWPVRSIGITDGESWELCEKKTYKGNCASLTASVPDTRAAGTIEVVLSARPAKK